MNESSSCFTFLPTFGVISIPDFGLSNRCLAVSCCLFVLNFGHTPCSMCDLSSPTRINLASPALEMKLNHWTARKVPSHCYFNLHLPDDIWCRASCMCLFAISISSLVKCLLKSLIHFLIKLFSCWVLKVLCTFGVTLIYQMYLLQYFLLVCGLFLILSTLSITEQIS